MWNIWKDQKDLKKLFQILKTSSWLKTAYFYVIILYSKKIGERIMSDNIEKSSGLNINWFPRTYAKNQKTDC